MVSYTALSSLISGYHQRVHEEGTPKTSFGTHACHYEFLTPSGLTNAPVAFQATTNMLFKPLRKFIIVFFHDILVYSPILEDHL